MSEITLSGVTYPLTAKPTHRSCIAVRAMQKASLFKIIDIDAARDSIRAEHEKKGKTGEVSDKELNNKSITDILMEQVFTDPAKMSSMSDMEEEAHEVGVIMLVAGLSEDSIGDMYHADFVTLRDKCVEVLGGDITAFFPDSNMNTSSQSSEAVSMSEKVERDCATSPLANQPQSLSETSNDGQ
ncbi:MAG: hypothetical protein KAJ03_02070, partial [Gammaproteobacteria bacterium]|nr:hypothetical protein [Gammaproteobacteria bacterium]